MGNVGSCLRKQRKESKKPVSAKATPRLQDMFTVSSRPDAELLEVFKEYDGDKDGKITAKEFQQCFIRFNVELSPGEVCSIISQVDKDKDMLLSEQEFLEAIRYCPDLVKLQEVFTSFDNDQNGTISKEEFVEMARSILKPEESTQENVNALFTSMDADGDGQISFQEFTVLLKNPPDNIDQLFDTIDVNKDGIIEKHELKQAYHTMGMEVTDAELDVIFKAADTNQDQKLSRAEFRKKFVETESKLAHGEQKVEDQSKHPIQRQQPVTSQSPKLKPESLVKTLGQKGNEPKFQNMPPTWTRPKLTIQKKA